MAKYIKTIFLSIVIIVSFGLIFSPFVSLALPIKFTNRTYYRLFYSLIADKEIAGCNNDEAKALKIFQYIIGHQFMQGIPYSCKPMESLLYGEAFCDFQARALNSLLAMAGVQSRYAMLLNKEGDSPHTLNEVFLDNKWCVFDPSMNIIFKDNVGKMMSLEDVSNNPSLVYNLARLIALKKYKEAEYKNYVDFYTTVAFPMPYPPRMSTSLISQSHIFDHVVDIYFKLFKDRFFNFYQNLYLGLRKAYPKQEKDFKLFYKARNYHLAYRYDLALKYYNMLLKEYPGGAYAQDAVFFCGMLYFDMKDFSKAQGLLAPIPDRTPPGKWENAARFYLSKTYTAMGKNEESLKMCERLSVYKLSDEALEKLNNYKAVKDSFGKM